MITPIEAVARAITGSVNIQSQATHRIAKTVDGAAPRARQVSSTIAGVSDVASRRILGSQQIVLAVVEFNRQAGALQEGTDHFVARVRAA